MKIDVNTHVKEAQKTEFGQFVSETCLGIIRRINDHILMAKMADSPEDKRVYTDMIEAENIAESTFWGVILDKFNPEDLTFYQGLLVAQSYAILRERVTRLIPKNMKTSSTDTLEEILNDADAPEFIKEMLRGLRDRDQD